jgi:hypothetical protein
LSRKNAENFPILMDIFSISFCPPMQASIGQVTSINNNMQGEWLTHSFNPVFKEKQSVAINLAFGGTNFTLVGKCPMTDRYFSSEAQCILTATISSIAVEENEPNMTKPMANPAASPIIKCFSFNKSPYSYSILEG